MKKCCDLVIVACGMHVYFVQKVFVNVILWEKSFMKEKKKGNWFF